MATEPELKRHHATDALTDALKAMINGDDAMALERVSEAQLMLEHLVDRQDRNHNLPLELEAYEASNPVAQWPTQVLFE